MWASYNIAGKLGLSSYADKMFSDAARKSGSSTLQIIIKKKPTFRGCGGYETTVGIYVQAVEKPIKPYNARTLYSQGSFKEQEQYVENKSEEIRNIFSDFKFLENISEDSSANC